MSTIAIATTLIEAKDVVRSFVQYHLSIGFDKVYLFFDDPQDTAIDAVSDIDNVVCIRCDDKLREAWKSTPAYQDNEAFWKFIDTEVMARQILNLAIAQQLAAKENIQWILHIDVDEAFYSPHQPVKKYFDYLTESGIIYKTFHNYEAVPETDSTYYFDEVTLFKKNEKHYSWFEAGLYKLLYRERFFNYYEFGKSAGIVTKVQLGGVHEFDMTEVPRPEKQNILKRIILKLRITYIPFEPVILHYPVCSFHSFWRKYEILGPFKDTWFDAVPVLPFHRQARDIVATGDKEKGLTFYRHRVMIHKRILRWLCAFGLVLRINNPSKILQSVRKNDT